jgi:hypothetical protein
MIRILTPHKLYATNQENICKEQKLSIKMTLVVQTCNLSYSGGRDQEDHSLKPAQGNIVQETLFQKKKKKKHKKGMVE